MPGNRKTSDRSRSSNRSAAGRGHEAGTAPSRPQPSAIAFAIALVSARSFPEKKLREKIAARYDAAETDAAISRLTELGMVDDAQWAERFARDAIERSRKGRHRIRQELVRHGIGAAAIDAALERVLDADVERDNARILLERLRGRLVRGKDNCESSEPARGEDGAKRDAAARQRAAAAKNRLFRSMITRGYPPALVRDLLDVS